jgi:putative ABC transport system permease protein
MSAMEWSRLVRERLRAAAGAEPADDVVDELAEYLSERYEDRVAGGVEPAAARAEAVAGLDDLRGLTAALKARPRRRRQPFAPSSHSESRMLANLPQDLRYAARLLRRHPGFAFSAILIIAIGIGAATAIFSVVDAVLLRPLPYPQAERLVAVWETDRDSGTMREPASLPDLLDMRRQAHRVETFGGVIADELNLTSPAGEPIRLAGLYVSSDVLPMLGVRPVAGRLFTAAEYQSGHDDLVLISDRLWARQFDRDPRIAGRTVSLDDRQRVVVGVVPDTSDTGVLQWLLAADYSRGFADRDARSRVDVWAPLPMDVRALPRDTHPILALGRLASGASVPVAQQELDALMGRLERAYPENKARGAHVEPFTRIVLGRVYLALWVLLAGVGLVLVVACVNVANLLLVRGTARLREIALRSALGAAPRRLARQFLVENALLTALGGTLGIGVAVGLVRVLVAIAPADVPRLASIAVDARVLALALAMTAAVALVFGLVPVLQAWRLDLNRALATDGGRAGTGGPRQQWTRSLLVVAEVALAVVLTVGAGLMIRSLSRLEQVDPGFRTDHVLKAEFQLPASRYPSDFKQWPNFVEMHRFNAALLDAVRQLPGIEAAALAGSHPLDAGFTNSFTVVGRESEGRDWPEIAVRRLTPGYFGLLRVPLVHGRLLRDGDDTAAAPVALVNQAAARRFFGARDPLGQQIAFWGTARTIVGVVGNERFHGVAEPVSPAVYTPLAQTPSANGAEVLLVRAANAEAIGGALRGTIQRLDPGLAVFGEEPLAATLSHSFGQRRFVMQLLAAFAMVALLLAALGIYAVLSYEVAQRGREIGIRLALGAGAHRMTRWIVARGVRLTMAGLVLGGVAALAAARLLRALLFEVAPTDATTFSAVLVVLCAVALTASYLPARRAVHTDPLVALREE